MKRRIFFLVGMAAILGLGPIGDFGLVFGDSNSNSGFVLPQYSMKVSCDFKNADLKDILKAFSRQISVNFLTEQGIDVKGVTVVLSDVPVEEALEKILSAYGLAYEYDVANNLFLVKRRPGEAKEEVLVTRVYQLKFASVPGSAMAKAMGGTGNLGSGLGPGSGGGGSNSGNILAALRAVIKGKGAIAEDPRTNSLIITDVQENFPNIERLMARLDVPVTMVMIEAEMLDISKATSDKIGFNWSTGMTFSGGSRSIRFPYYGTQLGTITQGQMSFTGVGALLDFIKGQDDTKSLARPRIMTSDNQTAVIKIATDEAIGETCNTPSNGTTAGSTTCSAERTKTGVMLTVTPQTSLLTDEITLIVEPQVIDASKRTTFTVKTYANPEERGVKSILKVKSGDTIIIGGLLRREETQSISKIPFLGELPIVGYLFKNKENKKMERELVIFITPRIVADSDQYPGDQRQTAEGVLRGEQSISDMRAGVIGQEMDRIADK